jgi:hypothetical protein
VSYSVKRIPSSWKNSFATLEYKIDDDVIRVKRLTPTTAVKRWLGSIRYKLAGVRDLYKIASLVNTNHAKGLSTVVSETLSAWWCLAIPHLLAGDAVHVLYTVKPKYYVKLMRYYPTDTEARITKDFADKYTTDFYKRRYRVRLYRGVVSEGRLNLRPTNMFIRTNAEVTKAIRDAVDELEDKIDTEEWN